MSDILIIGRRNRRYLVPETEKGRLWIKANMNYNGSGVDVHVAVDVEHIEDIISHLKEEEITFNEQ